MAFAGSWWPRVCSQETTSWPSSARPLANAREAVSKLNPAYTSDGPPQLTITGKVLSGVVYETAGVPPENGALAARSAPRCIVSQVVNSAPALNPVTYRRSGSAWWYVRTASRRSSYNARSTLLSERS